MCWIYVLLVLDARWYPTTSGTKLPSTSPSTVSKSSKSPSESSRQILSPRHPLTLPPLPSQRTPPTHPHLLRPLLQTTSRLDRRPPSIPPRPRTLVRPRIPRRPIHRTPSRRLRIPRRVRRGRRRCLGLLRSEGRWRQGGFDGFGTVRG